MRKNFYVLTTVAVLGLMITSVSADTTFNYDFDDLTGGGYPGTPIDGQDGWTGSSNFNAIGLLAADAWGSGIAGYNIGGDSQAVRESNIESMGDLTELSFTLRARNNSNLKMQFGLCNCDTGEVAFTFGLNSNQWFIQAANDGTVTNGATGLTSASEGYLAVLTVDISANGGNGAGSLSVQNLSTSGALTKVAELQNINLGILNMDSSSLETWDGLYLGMLGGGATMDNLNVTYATATIPEPGTLALLLIGTICLAATRLRHRSR